MKPTLTLVFDLNKISKRIVTQKKHTHTAPVWEKMTAQKRTRVLQ